MKSLNPKIFAEKIFYFESVLENSDQIVSLIEDTNNDLSENSLISSWHAWESSSGDHSFGFRKFTNPEKYDTAKDEVLSIYDSISAVLKSTGEYYADALNIPVGVSAPISISKYLPNEYMGPHADEGDPRAHFSAVLYLNDNFSGGGLGFPNQDVFIMPKAGSVIVFPSWQPYVHDPKPATEVKYISPAFWFVENSPLKSA